MSGRRQLHLRVGGVDDLRVPGQPFEAYDSYCVCTYGHARHRTRLIEDSTSPTWSEEVVFDAAAVADGYETVVKFEIYSQGLIRDELLLHGYLELGHMKNAAADPQQQQHGADKAAVSVAADGSKTDWQQWQDQLHDSHSASGAAAAAAAVQLSPQASAASAASQAAAVGRHMSAADSIASMHSSAASTAAAGAGAAAQSRRGFCSPVTAYTVALLSPQDSSSSNSSGAVMRSRRSSTAASGNGLSGSHRQRSSSSSSHMSQAAGVLTVDVWWVQQPNINNTDTPPRVISFVHPPGAPHVLPYSSHSQLVSQWEEPAVAFVRLVVGRMSLGTAAAAAVRAERQPGSSSSSNNSAVAHAKVVLKQLRLLLRGDAAAKQIEEQQQQQQEQQQQQQLFVRPSLASIHNPKTLSLLIRDGQGGNADHADWDWHALGLDDDLDQVDPDHQITETLDKESNISSRQQLLRMHHSGGLHPRLSGSSSIDGGTAAAVAANDGLSAIESLTDSDADDSNSSSCYDDDISTFSSEPGISQSKQQQQQQKRRRVRFGRDKTTAAAHSSPNKKSSKHNKSSSSKARSQADKRLHVTVRVQLGDQPPKPLRPVALCPDGSAAVCQASVFAVVRPLQEAAVSYEVALSLGPRGPPLLCVVFQYSLLHLVRRSPRQPLTWHEWRQVARCTATGLKVPLPCLPGSFLDLSAFVADADCRAGMYQVAAVAADAVAAAALDDAAAAAAAAEAERHAAAAAAAAQSTADADEPLTGSESGDKCSVDLSQPTAGIDTAGSSSSRRLFKGVLWRRTVSKQQQQQQTSRKQQQQQFTQINMDKLKSRAAAGMEALAVRVGEELVAAADRLPAPVAQQVKGRFISRFFPQTRRNEVYSIGQLRVMSRVARTSTAGVPAAQMQQPDFSGSSSSAEQQQQLLQQHSSPFAAAGVPDSVLATAATMQQQADGSSSSSVTVQGSSRSQISATAASSNVSGQIRSDQISAADLRSTVSVDRHPNVATAGGPSYAPLGILKITIQAVTLRSSSSSSSASNLQLLMRVGPHWLQLQQQALPLTFYSSSSSSRRRRSGRDGGSSSGSSTPPDMAAANRVPPVQVLLPVYGSSSLVSLLVHRRQHVVGRCVFKLYGLLPLLLKEHTKTLTLYSEKRGSSAQRHIAGSLSVAVSASPPPNYSTTAAVLRLAYSYLVTPYPLEMHTSGVVGGSNSSSSSSGRDDRDDAAGRLVAEWLTGTEQGRHALPGPLVRQLVSTGRGHVSGARMRGHVRRIKAVLLDWLPRRLDPLAFYHWKRPRQNIFVLWLVSHVCMYTRQWLLAVAIIVTLVLMWRIAVQIKRGVLGFELEQLPSDMTQAAGVPQQQQQYQTSDDDEINPPGEDLEASRDLQSLRSTAGQIGNKMRKDYQEAADKLRTKLEQVKQQQQQQQQRSNAAAPAGPAPFPKSLAELRDQLEAGTLNLDSMDIEAVAKQLLSVSGLLKLARQHSTSVFDYALVAQNILDDAAGFAEGLYAMLTAQDPLAALLFCWIFLCAAGFCYVLGVGAGVFVVICVLLRPPLLRGVPGVFGWKALLANLPSRSVEELM